MSNDKKLIEVLNIPKYINLKEFTKTILQCTNLNGSETKELAGVIMNEDESSTQTKSFMIYFRSMNLINRMKEICIQENENYFLLIFNAKALVKFPDKEFCQLDTLTTANKQPRHDIIKIYGTEKLNILNLIEKLPSVYHNTDPQSIILSVVQNKYATYIKFDNIANAERVLRHFRRNRFNANFSNTYTCFTKEEAREVVINENPSSIQIQRRFNEPKVLEEESIKSINLGRIKNINKLRKILKTGSWKLMLVRDSDSDS